MTIRGFLARGHRVRVEHLFRGREPRAIEAVPAHYERIAEGLHGLRWISRGPFSARFRMWIELTLAAPEVTAHGVRRFPPEWC